MEKVIRDGLVAVCYSPGFGAGWSTWADDGQRETMLFHPKIVKWVEDKNEGRIPYEALTSILEELFGADNTPYDGGARDLEIEWLPAGTSFQIDEYDGHETIIRVPLRYVA